MFSLEGEILKSSHGKEALELRFIISRVGGVPLPTPVQQRVGPPAPRSELHGVTCPLNVLISSYLYNEQGAKYQLNNLLFFGFTFAKELTPTRQVITTM